MGELLQVPMNDQGQVCTCKCGFRSAPTHQAAMRKDIVCKCCDRRDCPVHTPQVTNSPSQNAERRRIWEKLAQTSSTISAGEVNDKLARGVPQNHEEEVAMVASLLDNDLELRDLLLLIPREKRRGAYYELKPLLNFQCLPYDMIVGL